MRVLHHLRRKSYVEAKSQSRDIRFPPLSHLHNLYWILPYLKGNVVTVFGAAQKDCRERFSIASQHVVLGNILSLRFYDLHEINPFTIIRFTC